MLANVRQAVADSARRCRRFAGTSALAVGVLALALGAAMLASGIGAAVLIAPVNAPEPSRLVAIDLRDERSGAPGALYHGAFELVRDELAPWARLAMYAPSLVRVAREGMVVDAGAEAVTPEYFEVAGLRMDQGRFLTDADIFPAAGVPPAAVLSARLWHTMTGGRPQEIGTFIKVEGVTVSVVGIASPASGALDAEVATDIYLPISFSRIAASEPLVLSRSPFVVGRLQPGITLERLASEASARWVRVRRTAGAGLPTAAGRALESQALRVESLERGFSGLRTQYGDGIRVVSALSSLLLAIGVLNVAALLAVRALARRHEIAIKRALGASVAALIVQELLDGVLLAATAFAVAWPAAHQGARLAETWIAVARPLPLAQSLAPSALIVAAGFIAAITIGILIAGAPAVLVLRTGPDLQRRAVRTVTGGSSRSVAALLAGQVALSLVLAVLGAASAFDLGTLQQATSAFGRPSVLWARLARNPADRHGVPDRAYFQTLVAGLEANEGAATAALTIYFPAFLGFVGDLPKEDWAPLSGSRQGVTVAALGELVTPGFFQLYGIPILAGRDVAWSDDAATPPVALVNQAAARRLFQDANPVGQPIALGTGAERVVLTVVGVTAGYPAGSLREPTLPVVFRPMAQVPARARFPLAHVQVRERGRAARAAFAAAVERPGRHFVRGVFSLDEWLQFALLRERLSARVALAAAALAALLAGVGVFALLAYAVRQRRREIAIRMAVGAAPDELVRQVVGRGLVIVVSGIVAGIPAVLLATRLMATTASLSDRERAVSIAMAALAFLAIGVLASLIPAREAARVAPARALNE